MKFGTQIPFAGPLATPENVVRFARAVEAMGFDNVRCGDHVLYPKVPRTPYPYTPDGSLTLDPSIGKLDVFTTFAYLAGQTTHLRFESAVVVLPLRSPFVTAGLTATLDYLSGGRFTLEVGAGWMRDEYDILRVPWQERGRLMDEYLAILRTLFAGDGPFEGKYFSFPEVYFLPKPVQQPFPIYIGQGLVPAALRRVARYAQGFAPVGATPEQVAAVLPRLYEYMAEEGRAGERIDLVGDLGLVEREASSRDELLRRLEQMGRLGFTTVGVRVRQLVSASLDGVLADLEWFAEHVMREGRSM